MRADNVQFKFTYYSILGQDTGLVVKEETRNQIVVSLNPGAVYWMDIFHIDLLLNCYVQLKRLKINEKDAVDGLFFKMDLYRSLLLYFRLFHTVSSTNMFFYKSYRGLDLNLGPLVSAAHTVP